MSRLRLDLIVRRYPSPSKVSTESRSVGGFGTISATYEPQPDVDRWTWRLWSGSRIVSSSNKQLYSRRVDCVRGAEVGAGLTYVDEAVESLEAGFRGYAYRWTERAPEDVEVRLIDERAVTS